MRDWASVWREAPHNRKLDSLKVRNESPDQVRILAAYSFTDDEGDPVATWEVDYAVNSIGEVHVNNRLEKAKGMPDIPRVGMNMELLRKLDRVNWFGRGPFENYNDRQQAANVGLYENHVGDHYVAYVRPQENGYKTDVRWVELDDGSSAGLKVQADELIYI